MSSEEDRRSSEGFAAAFRHALRGLLHTARTERNMKIHLVAAALVLFAGLLLRLNRIEWALVAFCVALVVAGELINTAIEAAVDLLSPELHPRAQVAKDAAAAAVLVCAVISVVVGLLVFIPALGRLLK
jgi:diacylglycerol kinase